MSQAIDHAINQCTMTIDNRLLEAAFPRENQFDLSNLGHRIRTRIIDKRVIPDLNIASGQMLQVSMMDCKQKAHTDGSLIVSVDPKALNNLEILYPVEIMFQEKTSALNGLLDMPQNAYVASVIKMLNGASVMSVGDAHLVKIDGTTFWAKDVASVASTGFVNLMVANDPDLQNLDIRMYGKFANIVEQAVKSFMYAQRYSQATNNLFGGMQQGMYESMVSDFSGAEERYQELKQRSWRIGSIMMDPIRRKKNLSAIIPS